MVPIMDNQNDNLPLQLTTIDSEGNGEPNDLHALWHLPNSLINPSKRDDDEDDFMRDISEENRENSAGYDGNENAYEVHILALIIWSKIVDLSIKVGSIGIVQCFILQPLQLSLLMICI